jgi:site-specific DNA-methyltransferase (adenine-specific)
VKNALYCGDNLEVLRRHIRPESVDLAYVDPPFHSERNYGAAFQDRWRWDQRAAEGHAAILTAPKLGGLIEGLAPVVGRGSLLAYLVHTGLRIAAMERVLKPAGSLFVHCDPAASHYLKLMLDAVFSARGGGFRNEIVWCYSHGGRSKRWFGRKHDIIFFYSKSAQYHFDASAVRVEMRSGKESFGGRMETDADGRQYRLVYGTRNGKGETRYYKYYLDEGKAPEDWWVDINSLQASSVERVGYPTQKPEALAERIILACSREGDTVLDAYCGSGTTLVAAERNGRSWIGIDISQEAVELARRRVERVAGRKYQIGG